TASSVPTAVNFPLRIATACTTENEESTVTILPLVRISSGAASGFPGAAVQAASVPPRRIAANRSDRLMRSYLFCNRTILGSLIVSSCNGFCKGGAVKNDGFDRRTFLKGAMAGSAAAATVSLPRAADAQPTPASQSASPPPNTYAYLNPDEAAFVEALVDHMVPAD